MTKVHRITLLVIDHDNIGRTAVVEQIENTRYANRCIAPRVLAGETREVEWSDDHPLNHRRSQANAVVELFEPDVDARIPPRKKP